MSGPLVGDRALSLAKIEFLSKIRTLRISRQEAIFIKQCSRKICCYHISNSKFQITYIILILAFFLP